MLGLRFCARAFSSCGEWGPLFITVRGPITIAASLVAEHGLQTHRLSNCGLWAQLLCGMWDPPRPGLKPVSSALAGRFSTTAPPGKPGRWILNHCATREALHYGLSQDIEYSFLCYTIGPCCLSILYVIHFALFVLCFDSTSREMMWYLFFSV